MRDPHVQAIFYKISSGEGFSYVNPESVSFSNDLGTFDLNDGRLRVVPRDHFTNEADAHRTIEPFLQAWEIETDLTSRLGLIRFKCEGAEVIDRNPPPLGSSQVIEVGTASIVTVGCSASLHTTHSKYLQPPKTFRVTPDVQSAYERWLGYRSGKEPLQGMAYFVLTCVESIGGGRKGAAHFFQIDSSVLSKIGNLSSTKGDKSTARKAGTNVELSDSEKQWLEQTMRRVIHRLGEHSMGAPLTLISLCDLPSL
ncbi:MAG: hypothetical protein ABI988_13670 [Nitrospirota bacterium]